MPAIQFQQPRYGEITPVLRRVAERENRDLEFVRQQVADGQALILSDQDARDADGDMTAIDDETDSGASSTAEVNLPPVGIHDTSGVPVEIEIDGVTFTPEEPQADD